MIFSLFQQKKHINNRLPSQLAKKIIGFIIDLCKVVINHTLRISVCIIFVYLGFGFELDSGAELGEENEIENDWSGEQRVLTGVVHHNGALSAHKYLRCVLVHCSLAVPNIRHILNTKEC